MTKYLLAPLLAVMLSGCQSDGASPAQAPKIAEAAAESGPLQRAYFASGCFWCVEAVFESVDGVAEAVSGYAGGHTEDPTYQTIGTGQTGHAEAVEVYYDPSVVTFATLVDVFYASHDPTTVNGQAPDFGTQYRSIIFYQDETEQRIAQAAKAAVAASGKYEAPIATEIVPLERFYRAEDEHQDYERLHPDNSYVRRVSIPRLNRFRALMPQVLKAELAPAKQPAK